MLGKLGCVLLLLFTWGGIAAAEHPRLFFTSKDIPSLQKRTRSSHRKYVQAARTMLEWDLELATPLPTTPTRRIDDWSIEPWTARMVNACFLWAATGDQRVLEQARKWLLGLCQCRAAADNSYTYGEYALALATAYDVLYNQLTPQEQEKVRRHLGTVAQGLYESATGKARGWWRQIYLHHDYWIPTCGMGVAALALKDEDERWKTWYALARKELTLGLSTLGKDGAWHEGVGPWCYGMSSMLPFVEASRNVAGDDLYRFEWFRNTARARLHFRLPDGTYVFYGDSYRNGRYGNMGAASSHLLRLLAARFHDGYAQWLAQQDEKYDFADFEKRVAEHKQGAPTPGTAGLRALYCAGWSLIWLDSSIEPVPPDDLPTYKLFDNLGYVVARSGWSKADALLTFRAGPVAGKLARERARRLGGRFAQRMTDSAEHAHMDQNVSTYYAQGTYWINSPGYGARSSARHTTIAINGKQQVKDSLTEPVLLRHEFTDDYVHLLGDASSCYPADVRLERFHRHLVWLKPDVLVICDDLRTSKPTTFEWRLHPERRLLLEFKENRLILSSSHQQPDIALVADFLRPGKLGFALPTKGLDCIVAKPEGSSKACVFLVVISSAKAGVKATALEVEGGKGVLLERGAERQAIIFSLEPLCGVKQVSLSYTLPGGKLTRHLVVGLPAAAYLKIARARSEDGSITIGLSPGKDVQTSLEGTLVLK